MDVVEKFATAERLRDGARRQQSADPGALGRADYRHHDRIVKLYDQANPGTGRRSRRPRLPGGLAGGRDPTAVPPGC